MELDNKKKASRIKLLNMSVPLLVIIGMAMVYLLTDTRKISYALYAVVFLILYIIILSQIKPMFVSVFVGPNMVRFRFKSLSPFNTSNQTIQLKPEQFNRFEIVEEYSGIKKQLILFINSPSGLAKYPAISLSALKKADIEMISKALKLIMAMNKAANK